MEIISKIEQIVTNLEADRTRALAEFEAIRTDVSVMEPRFRHLAREVGGQLLKLAIDASISMAKVMEPLTKDTSFTGSSFGRKEILEIIEGLDKKSVLEDNLPIEKVNSIQEEIIDQDKILEEINEIIDVASAKK
jgi:hypothetical protein